MAAFIATGRSSGIASEGMARKTMYIHNLRNNTLAM